MTADFSRHLAVCKTYSYALSKVVTVVDAKHGLARLQDTDSEAAEQVNEITRLAFFKISC